MALVLSSHVSQLQRCDSLGTCLCVHGAVFTGTRMLRFSSSVGSMDAIAIEAFEISHSVCISCSNTRWATDLLVPMTELYSDLTAAASR